MEDGPSSPTGREGIVTFHPAIRWEDDYALIVGTPEEVLSDSRNVPLPRLPIFARCTWCWTLNQVGAFYWPSEPIPLDDGTTSNFEDWKREAERNHHLKGRFRRIHCGTCEGTTDHLAAKP